MKKIEDCDYGYIGIVQSFDVDIVLDTHDNDYQGDSYYILKDGDRYGLLIFGWGSCSGCDAYEAVYGYGDKPRDREGLYQLRDELWKDVKWFDDHVELYEYMATNDELLQWYGNEPAYQELKNAFSSVIASENYLKLKEALSKKHSLFNFIHRR